MLNVVTVHGHPRGCFCSAASQEHQASGIWAESLEAAVETLQMCTANPKSCDRSC